MNELAMIPAWLQKSGGDKTWSSAPTWLTDFRRKQWDAFLKNGLPTRKDERWKYTDLSFLTNKNFSTAARVDPYLLRDVINQHRLQRGESILLVCVNGYFMETLSDIAKLPRQVIACSMGKALQHHADIVRANWPDHIDAQKYPFASLNAAMFEDGLFLSLPDDCEINMPVHLLSLVFGDEEFIAQPLHMIVLGQNSKLTLAEECFSHAVQAYMMNSVMMMTVGNHAKLDVCKIQQEGRNAVHMANIFITQKRHSQVSFTNFSSGSLFARDDLVVKLLEPGADCHTSGFYRLRSDGQYVDYHIDIDHAAPHSNSEMLYKGILDKKSRAVFNGRLFVEKDAQKILAYQANHNLLLSSEAEVYSKPELEIYADDVKCKHGATTGQIDQEALFYMRSRGIDKEEAMDILLRGFAEEVMQRVTHPGIKMRIQETMY